MKNYLKKICYTLSLLILTTLSIKQEAKACETYSPVQFDFRSLPVVGFFPLSGNLSIQNTEFSTYIGGLSVDLFNNIKTKTYYYKKPISNEEARLYTLCHNPENPLELQKEESRITWLNISTYLLGVNLATLNQNEKTNLVKLAYLRIGPHFKLQGFMNNNLALGGQIGYAFLLNGDLQNANTRFQHGIDASLTFTWLGSPIPKTECKDQSCYKGEAEEDSN